MTATLLLEQIFNGLQAGVMLFLIAAGLTLVLGIMDFVFLAHGSQVMIGAYAATALTAWTGNFYLGVALAIPLTFVFGLLLETLIIRHLYHRDHMEQVLASFGLILFFNELVRIGFGPAALFSNLPPMLSGAVTIFPDAPYPVFRLVVIGVGLLAAVMIWLLVTRTRLGALVRAGASNRTMAAALGVNIALLQRFVFAIGACLAGIAGMMLGPITTVESGMGEPLLILSLVVIIIGGVGSVQGAFIAAIMVGLVDTTGRVLLPHLLRSVMDQATADGAGPALASMLVYIFMSVVLVVRPRGLFPPKG
ncbi:MAG: branched-chain amino acid ABC transporter permease [SAR116 cluster bacterium MED-G04]|jgi:branched-chain amino acid transport system permease protein|nr:MAG: branched-chain amino acid ABC transporter permease [SAR116 cluster bacterium MED-G04]CAI8359053.1 MAG: High-affinity branched-chain amino acid transport system permease protein LivH [SAR116 cluster bacterium MED-G04]HCV62385.1 branched-chain amino acid ABC transporter permease [Alphaproteobacteria bacterium]|tara:strand:- start:1628 stop:2548 length:921 start_codon:yes stop_codon:yes gene_type:complete